ncbi:unnamed protein product [Blepharisma stoltei]|uniref:Uncharacterized protein n=1 Tax=Blepharisma stoltei TaxID=1481888 RepID=A0AAU9INK6_9CILI|nr:unnamed protein product [Blepharisma stoltei]
MNSGVQIPVQFHDSDFREVQIQDQSENPKSPFIMIPAGSRPGGFQPIALSQLDSVPPIVSPLDPKDIKYRTVLKHSKRMRLLTILDMILCLLYLLIGQYILLFLAFFALLGFFSSFKLSRGLLMSYIITLIFIMILKILLAAEGGAVAAVLMILYFVVEAIILYFAIKFFKLLGTLEPQERLELLMLQNGPVSSNQGITRSEAAQPVQIPIGRPLNEQVPDNSPQLTPDFAAPKFTNLQPVQAEFPSLPNYSEAEELHVKPLTPSDRLE